VLNSIVAKRIPPQVLRAKLKAEVKVEEVELVEMAEIAEEIHSHSLPLPCTCSSAIGT